MAITCYTQPLKLSQYKQLSFGGYQSLDLLLKPAEG